MVINAKRAWLQLRSVTLLQAFAKRSVRVQDRFVSSEFGRAVSKKVMLGYEIAKFKAVLIQRDFAQF